MVSEGLKNAAAQSVQIDEHKSLKVLFKVPTRTLIQTDGDRVLHCLKNAKSENGNQSVMCSIQCWHVHCSSSNLTRRRRSQ